MSMVEARTGVVVNSCIVVGAQVCVPGILRVSLVSGDAFEAIAGVHLVARPALRLQFIVPFGTVVHTRRVVFVGGLVDDDHACSLFDSRELQSHHLWDGAGEGGCGVAVAVASHSAVFSTEVVVIGSAAIVPSIVVAIIGKIDDGVVIIAAAGHQQRGEGQDEEQSE